MGMSESLFCLPIAESSRSYLRHPALTVIQRFNLSGGRHGIPRDLRKQGGVSESVQSWLLRQFSYLLPQSFSNGGVGPVFLLNLIVNLPSARRVGIFEGVCERQ